MDNIVIPETKKKSYTWLIIVLIIIIIGIGSYILYDKVLKDNPETKNCECEKCNCSKDKEDDKKNKNKLSIDANEIVKIAQTKYAEDIMNGNAYNTKCYSIKTLKDSGYLDMEIENYSGSVLITMDETGSTTYKIWLSDGKYKLSDGSKDGVNMKTMDESKNIVLGENTSNTCGD